MEENLVVWMHEMFDKRKYDIMKIIDSSDGLKIFLMDIDSEDEIVLYYDSVVCAYNNVEDSFWIDEFEKYTKKYGENLILNNTVFLVENSKYAKIMENGSCGSIEAVNLWHIKIIAANAMLDVVSFGKPIVYINK